MSDAPRRSFFPKSSKLSHASEFALVRERGKSVAGRHLILGYMSSQADQPARVGIITSKRLGNAVERNKVRRRLREVVRMSLPDLKAGLMLVIVARKPTVGAPLSRLSEEWMRLIQRCSILNS